MALHKKLRPYTELMHWCKVMDRKAYTGLTNVYTQGLGKIYERDIKQFLEEAKQQITGVVGMSSTIVIRPKFLSMFSFTNEFVNIKINNAVIILYTVSYIKNGII